MRGTARMWRAVAAIGLALGGTALGATPAWAHANLVRSTPGNGAVLATAPTEVRLQFDVPVTTRLSAVFLFDGAGRPVPGATVHRSGASTSLLVVELPRLSSGVYRLNYRTRSDTDLHQTTGGIVFGVGESAELLPVPAAAAAPSVAETAARWIELAGIALLVGIAAGWLAILPAAWRRATPEVLRSMVGPTRRRLVLLATAGYAAILVGKAGELAVAAQSLVADGSAGPADALGSVLVSSRFGVLWLAGTGLAVVVLLAARAASRALGAGEGAELRPSAALLLVATEGLIVVDALAGHGSNQAGLDPAQAAFRMLHLAAAGLWIGGLAVLLVLFLGTLRRRGPGLPVAVAAFRRFSGLAFLAVGVLGISGLVMAGQDVASADALVTTPYGLTLAAKLVVAAAALALGLRHTLLLRPRRDAGGRRGLARSLPLEAGAMALVLAGAAAMGSTAPAPEAAELPVLGPAIQADTSVTLDDITVRTSMDPDRPGANTVFLQVRRAGSAPTRPVSGVQVTLSQPGSQAQTLTGSAVGNGHYKFPRAQVAAQRPLTVELVVDRGDGPPSRATFPWPVRPPLPTRTAPGPLAAPWAPVLNALAALLAVGLAVVAAGRLVRARRRRGGPDVGLQAG